MMNSMDNIAQRSQYYSKSRILETTEINPHIFRIRFENPLMASHSLPGQFINIKVSDEAMPLWRRPFSIHRVDATQGWAEILFRVIGKGTELLAKKKPGDLLNAIGPLGNSFTFNSDKTRLALIVAGGLGIAPFLFLCDVLQEHGIASYLFYGAKTKAELCCLQEFGALTTKIYIATEDGSFGYRGFITELVNNKIGEIADLSSASLFACGPNPMLQRLHDIATAQDISCQVSLETLMACGIGACLGCGVKTNEPEIRYHYVCKNGPVFNSREIQFGD